MRGATIQWSHLEEWSDLFQSTLLMRGATKYDRSFTGPRDISIHAPHARSDRTDNECRLRIDTISIHAPHARSDSSGDLHDKENRVFQSTLLMRGATAAPVMVASKSIFQSTLLMRGATLDECKAGMRKQFQSTLLMRGATNRRSPRKSQRKFQSTLLMRGATLGSSQEAVGVAYFNPRSSCEERLCYFQALICLTSSYIFREPLTSFRKHFF